MKKTLTIMLAFMICIAMLTLLDGSKQTDVFANSSKIDRPSGPTKVDRNGNLIDDSFGPGGTGQLNMTYEQTDVKIKERNESNPRYPIYYRQFVKFFGNVEGERIKYGFQAETPQEVYYRWYCSDTGAVTCAFSKRDGQCYMTQLDKFAKKKN